MGTQYIFITGAASGMGLATAKLFRDQGWYVGGYDINADDLNRLEADLGDNGHTRVLDVTDKSAFDQALQEFSTISDGRLDIMFNNAGIGVSGFFDEIPFEKILEVVNVNFVGVLNGVHAAIPLLRETENSLNFITSSSAATYGAPGLAVYAATKHAVKGLTEALSVELARYGTRAADVLPGLIDTPILRNTPRYLEGEQIETDNIEDALAAAPKDGIFRMIQPEEVANTVWDAYHSDQLHWYVPPELVEIDKAKALSPETLRDQRIGMASMLEAGTDK